MATGQDPVVTAADEARAEPNQRKHGFSEGQTPKASRMSVISLLKHSESQETMHLAAGTIPRPELEGFQMMTHVYGFYGNIFF